MARTLSSLLAFNRGLISALAVARIDLKRLALSAQTMVNWMPRVLGSMMLRPGTAYLGSTASNNAARFIPFVFSTTDTALLEFTTSKLRIWVDETPLTRPSVTTTITNGTFATNLTGWTDLDAGAGVSSWSAPGYMQLVGDGTNAAIREQQVTVAGATLGILHALRIVIIRGPVTLTVGSSSGGQEYIRSTTLNTGTHSITLIPSGNFYVRFASTVLYAVFVDSCTIESGGIFELPSPYLTADLDNIRTDQSADVVFVACGGYQQRRIERRNDDAWSIVLYLTPDGPFMVPNITAVTMAPTAISGSTSLTASSSYFRTDHTGALFSIDSVGQNVSVAISSDDTFSNYIRVTGIGATRAFVVLISGWAAGDTITLQRSIGAPGVWADVISRAADTTESYNDTLDNQIIYYRIGIKTGDYAAGTVTVGLGIGTGTITGVARVTGYISPTVVNIDVLTSFGSASASTTWSEGAWSDLRGWPSSVAIYEGRLWWSGKSGIFGSISDTYDGFDPSFVGDAGAINRTVGSGPVDTINWILPLQRLIVGGPGAEYSCRASTLDQPLTPTTFNIRKSSTQGSAAISPVVVDLTGIYVQRGGTRVYKLQFNNNYLNYEYSSEHLSQLVPEVCEPSVARMAVQRQPDTRVHFVLSDGTVAILVFDETEDVKCWIKVETDGLVEDVVVLPSIEGEQDDQVYYCIKRTINGSSVRYVERWAQESDCRGGTVSKLADSHVVYSGVPTTTITGLSHIEGETVAVWADGFDVGTDDTVSPWTQRYTVSGGQITLDTAASNVVVGLHYTAQFKSTKLGQSLQGIESPLNQQKRVNHLGLILANTYTKGLKFGPEFDYLDDMPGIEQGTSVTAGASLAYDEEEIEFPGTWNTDTHLCLQAQSPRPCTVLAATISMEINR